MAELSRPTRPEAEEITLRPMTLRDIPFGLQLSLDAGWNQTEADWRLLLENSRAGCFVACCGGEKAGTATTLSYEERIHWIGMVLVAERFRRRGIGTRLLDAALQAVRGQGAAWLDATPAGRPIYEKMGFTAVYPLARWLRPPGDLTAPACRSMPLTGEQLPSLLAYDRPIFGAGRAAVLGALLRNTPLAFSCTDSGRLRGYCLGRLGSRYTHIGPLCADDPEIARDLLLSALGSCAFSPVIVDTPFHQPGWVEFLAALGFAQQRPFTRMCMGRFALPSEHRKQLAVAGPELG